MGVRGVFEGTLERLIAFQRLTSLPLTKTTRTLERSGSGEEFL
jgi:hypothetical protein